MRKITVQPEQLDSCAVRMETHNQDYQKYYQELFSEVDKMALAWQGKDNTAFTSQISKYQTDCRYLSLLCTQYADFLKNSAQSYRDIEDELASQARSLAQS